GGFGAFVAFGNLFELIGQGAYSAACILEIGGQDSALAIEQVNLLGNLAIGGKSRAAGGIHGGFQFLVIGSGVKGLFGRAALGDLFLEIAGIQTTETVLIGAPRTEAKKFAVERPSHRQQQQKSRDQNKAAQWAADDGIVLLRGKIRQAIPPQAFVSGTKRDYSLRSE